MPDPADALGLFFASRADPPFLEFVLETPKSLFSQVLLRRTIMKNYFLPLGLLLFAGVAAPHALADSYFLIGTNSPGAGGVPCSGSSPCAEVTITATGNTATFTVSSLDSGYVFDTFGFNFTGAGTLTLSGTPTGEVSSPTLANDNGAEDGWGKFDYTFTTGKNGGSSGGDCVVTGGTPGAGCTFSFTVTDASTLSLMTSEFESASSGGSGTGFYAGHMAAGNGSGYVGDSVPVGSPIPEPSSLMLLGTGVLGLAGVVRRRFGR